MRRCGERVAAGLATAVFLLVACGDDASLTPAAPTTTVAPTTTSTTLSQAQLDQQKAKRIVLTAADLPDFVVDPPGSPDNDPETEAAVQACFNNNALLIQVGDETDSRGASSPEFTKDDVTIDSSVTFADTEDDARAAIAAVSGASFPGCFARAISAEVRTRIGGTNVTVNTTKLPALRVGDESVGFRTRVQFRIAGTTIRSNFEFTFIRVGRAFAVVESDTDAGTFPDAERVRLATILAGRMAAP